MVFIFTECCEPCLQLSACTIVFPSHLDIRRPMVWRKEIGRPCGEPALPIGRGLGEGFYRFTSGRGKQSRVGRMREEIGLVSNPKKKVEISAGVMNSAERGRLR
jgi:hypothetical protein